jgi:hypothetical protein
VTCSFPRLFLPHLVPRLPVSGPSAPWLLPPCSWRPQTSQFITITMSDLNTARVSALRVPCWPQRQSTRAG